MPSALQQLRSLLPLLEREYLDASTAVPTLMEHRLALLRALVRSSRRLHLAAPTPALQVQRVAHQVGEEVRRLTPAWPAREADCHRLAQRLVPALLALRARRPPGGDASPEPPEAPPGEPGPRSRRERPGGARPRRRGRK